MEYNEPESSGKIKIMLWLFRTSPHVSCFHASQFLSGPLGYHAMLQMPPRDSSNPLVAIFLLNLLDSVL